MGFYDEVLIRKRNELQKAKYDSLETGMYVNEKLITFQKMLLFEGKVSMYLPDDFIDMPLEWKKRKYPYENRPQVIYMDLSGSVNVCFSLLPQESEPNQLMETLEGFLITIKKINASNVLMDKGVLKAVNLDCAWSEIRTQNLDGAMCVILFLCEVGKELLLGTFSCPNDVKEGWKRVGFEVMRSICEEESYESR